MSPSTALASESVCPSAFAIRFPLLTSPQSTRRLSFRSRLGTCTDLLAASARETQYGNNILAPKLWKSHSVGNMMSIVLMEDEEKKAWEDCKQLVCTLNFSIEEADVILGKAFGWVNSPYWGEERNKEIPALESLSLTLEFLRSLGLSDEDLHKVLQKFPEMLGCDLNSEVKANIVTLEKEWGIKGASLRSLLLRNPKVLGYNVDCKGDCFAKCTRCWVRF